MLSIHNKANFKFWAAIIVTILWRPYYLYASERVIESAEPKLIMEFSEGLNIPDGDSLKLVYTGAVTDPAALLRDTSGNPSYWGGNFWSNYGVIFVNPNGITIGEHANIQAASFIASTLDITNDNFLHPEKYNNAYIFSKWVDKVGKSVINNGYIKVREGGKAVLLGAAAANGGTIEATLGSVVLAAGNAVTLNLDSAGMISVVVDAAVTDQIYDSSGKKITSAVENTGKIIADGGKVVLSAKTLNNIFDRAINNSGIIQANSLVNRQGVIELVGEGVPLVNTGSIIANGTVANPNAGIIALSAEDILQKGRILANAGENGDTGEINIIAGTSAVLDESSSTEARALGLSGNGGRITVQSKNGKARVNKDAGLDVSAGAISGTAGTVYINAFERIGFFGIFSGRAPPDFQEGTLILDAPQIVTPKGTVTGITMISPTASAPIYVRSGGTLSVTYTIKLNNAYSNDQDITVNVEVGFTFFVFIKLFGDTVNLVVPAGVQTQQFTTNLIVPAGLNDVPCQLRIRAKHPIEKAVWDQTVTGNNAVIIDNTAPADFIPAATPSGWTDNNRVQIVFASTDSGSGMAGYQIKVDGAAFGPVAASPYPLDVSLVSDGDHTVTVKALDNAGNSREKSAAIHLDKTAPDLNPSILSGSPAGTPDGDNGWFVSNVDAGATAGDPASGLASLEYRVNSGGWNVYTNGSVLTTSNEGATTIDFRATDALGLVSTGSVNFKIDKTAPEIFITAPVDGASYTSPQALFYSVADNLDPAPVVSGAASGDVFSAAGSHNAIINAADAAGNKAQAAISFTIASGVNSDQQSQITNSTGSFLFLTDAQRFGQRLVELFTRGSSVYYYRPLTPVDMSAFDSMSLGEDAYQFIDGAISIIGHQGLLPFFNIASI